LVNDSVDGVTKLTSFLGVAAELVSEQQTPYLVALTTAVVGNAGYVLGLSKANVGDVTGNWDNAALLVKMDNNGSGDLTGGHSANTLKVIAYYAIEVL
jgi:hypothetical protein